MNKINFPKWKIKNNKKRIAQFDIIFKDKTEKNGDMTDEILENIAKKCTFKNKNEILLIIINKLNN